MVLLIVEGDAGAFTASASRAPRPVNVGFHIVGRLHLDDEVDIGDVQAAGGNISGHEHVELALSEALKGDFPLVLGDVSVHDLDVLLDLVC